MMARKQKKPVRTRKLANMTQSWKLDGLIWARTLLIYLSLTGRLRFTNAGCKNSSATIAGYVQHCLQSR